ncbi:cytochrome c biogenesis protein CcsA [Leptospira sp. 2 VSF19]|uniref:Cytochrome c biogenesis protein CcsA n=1 Tax=Leptospira soteropolitanensis TaxID=2950025 RepID=A0AAW5VST9_9LEPT|nr:cytochrome c biogenesis protein CcsA [Leptospira soteropolitanensis]MCW7494397.1 cytochrome c biogenesis protein CcsA [Leptospira soteropolitanensis]MCW7501894.1 cytochrome c biogenesis protein CcsA [Leptospira soteropolitanensis]MCW7524243.1 cytochrome c biogenesis protein CcsA [Leptospira soteropolitanensis]MCW7528108.1 cytochrome c biogenesis protein CcsA [Leptospira soteropolitanensis]MCW7531962.1 cytochrome c biogenesis protein CcsA [Leptospira soteropolitanensis]
MNNLGTILLSASLAVLIFSALQTIYGIFKQDRKAIELGRLALMTNPFVIVLTFTVLLTQLVRSDYSNYYVVMHSSEHLPLFYKMTSIWSGSSGSLLFWNLILSVFTFIVLWQTRKSIEDRIPMMNLILAVLSGFFSFLAVFYGDAQPFREFVPEAAAGRGLNPLLQHWAMIIHPPILYIGYVSISIPFAIAMSALVSGQLSEDWMKFIRKWTLFSWFFLGTGILLGSKWAYEELGWGGYWAWDPVENASLMPWLLTSAFVHSVVIQERRGMLKFWNMLLVILAFHFSLLGTWITRSGVLEGPHSFSKSTIGTPFIIYIIGSFLFFTGFVVYRRKQLTPERNLEAITSKEGSFLLNNFLLVLSTAAILLGVFSPLLYGKEFKAPWFNSWGVPAGIFLLLLMGAAPLLAWRKGAGAVFFSTLLKPLIAGLVGGGFYILFYSQNFTKPDSKYGDVLAEVYSILTVTIGVFTVSGIIQEYYRGIRARREEFKNENILVAGYRMLLKNKRRYGGYLVHFALVLIFIGYAGNAFKINTSVRFFYELQPPTSEEIVYQSIDKAMIGGYQIEASTLKLKPVLISGLGGEPNIQNVIVSQEGTYWIFRGTEKLSELTTERRFYPQISHLTGDFETHIPTSEPAILSMAKEDFYIQLGAIETSDLKSENPDLPLMFMQYYFTPGSEMDKLKLFLNFPKQIVANLEVWVNPLVKLIWVGSLLYFLSGIFLLLPVGDNKKKTV